VASEYRYRTSVPHPDTLVVTISQSGETADTLSALRHAQSLGRGHTLTICNVATSAMVRECALAYITRAGVEIGVASTKAFTTQLAGLFLLTLALAQAKGRLSEDDEARHLQDMRHLPVALQAVLALEPQLIQWAEQFAQKDNALFLGRGLHYPIALEGALKLKEISYIHAEAYPAGELKHGPLALVTSAMPVVTVAPNDALLEKLKSNMQEVRARGGVLYVLADADTHIQSEDGLNLIRMPEHYGVLSPILHVVPLQLLAYHTALAKGTDVDKPRNLAKSVTVEYFCSGVKKGASAPFFVSASPKHGMGKKAPCRYHHLYDKYGHLRSKAPDAEQGVIMTRELTEEGWKEVRYTVSQLRAGQISRTSAEKILRDKGVPGDAIPVILMYVPADADRSGSGVV
jgi:glutamine---fructose-6-phosphate transaminase (isomerizing)